MIREYCVIFLLFSSLLVMSANKASDTSLVYIVDIKREIGSTSWVHVDKGFKQAKDMDADAILIHMNTYGGEVVFADSIRTRILNETLPVYVFIDNNAASAGALISIACDEIYMRKGANIGAATVVDQSGSKMPDKYQSYMRATIRSTAEAHGKDTIISGNDTIFRWKRDPRIAEAMVDESLYVEGVSDTGKVLTFTALEAIEHHYCEGIAENIDEVLKQVGIKTYELKKYEPSFYDGLKGFLTNSMFRGILIMLILGGLYFELQSPGIGFPLAAAIVAAVIYFAPLYIDGLAANWEILIFIIGVVLIGFEVFVIPGFGIAGIAGFALLITGLVLSMLGNDNFDFRGVETGGVFEALLVVLIGGLFGITGSLWITKKFWGRGRFSVLSLETSETIEDGYIGVDTEHMKLIGESGVASTVLRPGGKVIVGSEVYDAVAKNGFIDKGNIVVVVSHEAGQIVVEKA